MEENAVQYDSLDEVMVDSFFENDQFFLAYQKKFSLTNPNVSEGLEAYIRLKAIGLESESPAAFLPVVRKIGRLPELTKILIDKLTNDWNALRASGVEIEIAINLDFFLLEDGELLECIVERLQSSKMPINKLRIDLVAVNCLNGNDDIFQGVRYLAEQGIKLSLEVYDPIEFSLDQLERIRVDDIKLNRNVFEDKNRTKDTVNFISGCKKLTSGIDGTVTAVGVESEEELVFLSQFDLDYVQGYLFGKPVAIGELEQSQAAPETEDVDAITILLSENGLNTYQKLDAFIEKGYQIVSVNNQISVIDVMAEIQPDIVVFEIASESDLAFSLATEINERDMENTPTIIFVSEEEDNRLHLHCYESYGFAYLHKEMAAIEFVACFNRAINIQKNNKKNTIAIKKANDMALQSMRDAASYGEIVQLMKAISLAEEESDISHSLFRFMNNQGLNCCAVFRSGYQVIGYDSTNIHCSETEYKIFELLKDKGRLYEFGSRIVVNSEHTAFLIKNLPDDDVQRGQIRDYVAAIIECMEVRCQGILQNRTIKEALSSLMAISMETVKSVEENSSKKKELVDHLNTEVGMSFHVLDLTVEQEEYLRNLLQKIVQEYDLDEESPSHLSAKLQSTIDSLSSIILQENKKSDASSEIFEDDVELF